MLRIFRDLDKWFESFNFADIENLRNRGEVTEETTNEGDLITKKIRFISNDGKTQIFRKVTTNQQAEKFTKLSELRTKINKLLREDNFEAAIPLRDELKKLESELQKPIKKQNPDQ